jgi:hypothetical protein
MTSQASKDARRLREMVKKRRRRAKIKAAKLALHAVTVSKTSPIYRRRLPIMPEMTKNQLRAVIATAVRNTAEMRA